MYLIDTCQDLLYYLVLFSLANHVVFFWLDLCVQEQFNVAMPNVERLLQDWRHVVNSKHVIIATLITALGSAGEPIGKNTRKCACSRELVLFVNK